jgi:hypothetical protein
MEQSMPDRDPNIADFSHLSQDDFEAAAIAAFDGGVADERLALLVSCLRSIAGSMGELVARPELPSGLRANLRQLIHMGVNWAPPGFDPAAIAIGALVSSSAPADFEVGYRGGGSRERLIFDSDLGEIEVDVSPAASGDRYVIRCQVDPILPSTSSQPGEAFLVRVAPSERVHRQAFGPDGFFNMEAVSGVYDLTIVIGGRAVRLPGIEVD